MAVKSNLTNMVLVLTLTCLVCSALLAGAYAITKEPMEAAAKAKTEKSLASVLPEFESVTEKAAGEVRYFEAVKDTSVVGYAIESSVIGFGGPLTIMVGITPDGSVWNTSVLSHSETPGLGAKCTSDTKFVRQWKGFNPSEKILSVKKDGGDIDAITASTITSRAYTLAVSKALDCWKSLQREGGENE